MTIEELFGTLQMSVVAGWRKHLKSAKYGKHIALQEFYEEMPDKVDALIEGWMGAHGKKVGSFQNILSSSNMNTLKYLQELKRICKEGYDLLDDNEELEGLMDDIVNLINSTLYKVKELSESSMMDLADFVNEALLNESKIKDVKTTVGDYVAWYFGVDNIDDVYLAEFESTDFDPSTLEEKFDNIYAEQLKYLKQNKNKKIVVKQVESKYNDIEVEFTVDDITFYPVATDIFTGK
jgi:DNA-binding ferritin-like protein